MGEWDWVSLGQVADLLTGFPFESKRYAEASHGSRLLRGDNIVQGHLRWDGAKWWSREDVDGLDRYELQRDDVVLAMDRPWIDAGLKYAAISETDMPALLVQRVSRLRGTKAVDNRFLKYVIGSPRFTAHVLAVQTGTAVPHISGDQIKGFRFGLPPLPEQRAIAHILGTLDDKIDLNRRMNETLEAIARALFKSWFVDFDPVRAKAEGKDTGLPKEIADLFPDSFEESELGEIPVGWGIATIGNIAEVVGGSTPSTKNAGYWEGGTHHWATPKDLSRLTVPVLLQTERLVTDEGLSQIGSGLLPKGTVLLSSRAPIGYLAIAEVPVAVNQGFIAMKPRPGVSNIFLLLWAYSAHDQILSRANGSTFLEISKASFRPISVAAVPSSIMQAFDDLVRPHYQGLVRNERESATLAALRDTLSPRLISGELRVKDPERFMEKVVA